jgi:hypothetical protein
MEKLLFVVILFISIAKPERFPPGDGCQVLNNVLKACTFEKSNGCHCDGVLDSTFTSSQWNFTFVPTQCIFDDQGLCAAKLRDNQGIGGCQDVSPVNPVPTISANWVGEKAMKGRIFSPYYLVLSIS